MAQFPYLSGQRVNHRYMVTLLLRIRRRVALITFPYGIQILVLFPYWNSFALIPFPGGRGAAKYLYRILAPTEVAPL